MASVSTMTLTPVVLGVLLDAGAGWRIILAGEAVLSLLLGVVLLLLPLQDIRGRENLRLRQVRSVVAFNPLLLTTIAAAAFLYIGGEMTLGVWLPKFRIDTFGVSPSSAGLAVTVYFVGQIVGRAAIVPFARSFLTSSLLLDSTALMAVFTVGISLAPGQTMSLALTRKARLQLIDRLSALAGRSAEVLQMLAHDPDAQVRAKATRALRRISRP